MRSFVAKREQIPQFTASCLRFDAVHVSSANANVFLIHPTKTGQVHYWRKLSGLCVGKTELLAGKVLDRSAGRCTLPFSSALSIDLSVDWLPSLRLSFGELFHHIFSYSSFVALTFTGCSDWLYYLTKPTDIEQFEPSAVSTGDLIRGWEAAKMANLPSPGQDIQDEDIFLGIFPGQNRCLASCRQISTARVFAHPHFIFKLF